MPLSVTAPTPLGIIPGTPTWYQLVARHQGSLLQPTLTETPPGIRRTTGASLPAIAGRQAKKFCYKVDTVFINSDIYIYINRNIFEIYFFIYFFILFIYLFFIIIFRYAIAYLRTGSYAPEYQVCALICLVTIFA